MISSALDYAQLTILGVFRIDPGISASYVFLSSIDSLCYEVITYALQHGGVLRTRQRL